MMRTDPRGHKPELPHVQRKECSSGNSSGVTSLPAAHPVSSLGTACFLICKAEKYRSNCTQSSWIVNEESVQ